MLKTKVKFLIIVLGFFIALCLFNTNTVNATTITSDDGKVFTENNIADDLINDISSSKTSHSEVDENGNYTNTYITTGYYINQSTLKTLDLILDEGKLDSLVQSDNYVYQSIYYQLDDGITKVTYSYENSNTEKDANIITKNNIRYAEIPIAVFIKIDGVYHHAELASDGVGNLSPNSTAKVKVYKNAELLNTLNFDTIVEDGQTYGASIYVTSTTDKKYYLGGAGGTTIGGNNYDRILAEGDCYINVDIWGEYIGETLKLEPFGILNYKGTTEKNGITSYTYQAKIKDKKIFNNDRIITRIALKNYKILYTGVLTFKGDLIVSTSDKNTGISMETTTNIVPKDTLLVVNSIDSGTSFYQEVNNIIGQAKNIKIYDITLKSNGVSIQPNGTVKISIPIPENFNTSDLKVYRIEGTDKIEYALTIEELNGIKYATFETDHFSTYVLADESTTEIAGTKTEKQEETTLQGEKDVTPKTGTGNTVLNNLGLIVGLGAVAIITKGFIK